MSVDEAQKQARMIINQRNGVVDRMTWGIKHPRIINLVSDWDYTGVVIHHSGNSGEKDPKRN